MKRDWWGLLENVFSKTLIKISKIRKKNYYNNFFFIQAGFQGIILLFLKNNSIFYKTQLTEITAYQNRQLNKSKNNLILVYNFYSFFLEKRLFFLFLYTKQYKITSITNLFLNADWLERETREMYGIQFRNSKDSRNLLLEYNYTYNPLLKNFPLIGYEEVKYEKKKNWLVKTKVSVQF